MVLSGQRKLNSGRGGGGDGKPQAPTRLLSTIDRKAAKWKKAAPEQIVVTQNSPFFNNKQHFYHWELYTTGRNNAQ